MKKIIAMLLCVALIAAFGVSAVAQTLWAEGIAVGTKGAGDVYVESSKTLTTAKSVEDYLKEKIDAKNALDFGKSDARKAAEAAKNLYAAEMAAAAEALKVANAQLAWAKADYNATATAMLSAAKSALTAYQNIYKAAVAQHVALEYLDFGVQYSNAMNSAIADMQLALVDALPAGTIVDIGGIAIND